jgi:putative N6-adenine-specific DNA methylase
VRLVAKTFFGLEKVLAKELEDLGAGNISILKRAVSFDANKELLYKSNLCLRSALRILQPLKTFTARNEDQLYKAVREYDWSHYLSNDKTFAIDPVVYSRFFQHSKYAALKVKDAICDQFRDKTGARPSIDPVRPDLLINLHIAEDKVTLSMDSSGDPLNQRGYRTKPYTAPINETLAAGMLLIAGYDGSRPMMDPMCGSGTFLIEAAMIASRMAPNIKRREFGFMRWGNYDPELWKRITEEAKAKIVTPQHRIGGSDISVMAIDIARQSALDFGLKKYIDLSVKQFTEAEANGRGGLFITNPPYQERLKSRDIFLLYSELGSQLKHKFSGWDAWIISGNAEALKSVGLKPSTRQTLYNGALECNFQKFELYEGSRKQGGLKSE